MRLGDVTAVTVRKSECADEHIEGSLRGWGVAMERFIGTIGVGVVVLGDGLPLAIVTDENGVAHQAEPVIWDWPYATPAFHVIGHAMDIHQAVEVARRFAGSCNLPFADFVGPS